MCDPSTGEERRTVARVRLQPSHADVMFFESERIYRLPRDAVDFDAAVAVLHEAETSGAAVCVRATADGAIAAVRRSR